jgi:hypothetical protein
MAQITRTQVAELKRDSYSSAPNGSVRNVHDFYTTVISREEWADVPENGAYAGRTYKIVERYISNRPDTRGQIIGSSSTPWSPEDEDRYGTPAPLPAAPVEMLDAVVVRERLGDLRRRTVTFTPASGDAVSGELVNIWDMGWDAPATERLRILLGDGSVHDCAYRTLVAVDARPVAQPNPLQAAVDTYRANPSRAARDAVRAAARSSVHDTGGHTVTVGRNTARVFVDGDRYRVEVLRDRAELLLAYGGTYDLERDALRSFASIVQLIAG